MPQLVAPTPRLHHAWLKARDEWGPGLHEDGFGLRSCDEVDTTDGFTGWVARLTEQSGPQAAENGRSCTYRWIVEDGRVHGGITLRHGTNDHIRQFGHIGYGVRPTSRRRGLATWALGRILHEAKPLGLRRVLIVCEVDNLASARTIEHQGGIPENIQSTEHGPVQRYWIKL